MTFLIYLRTGGGCPVPPYRHHGQRQFAVHRNQPAPQGQVRRGVHPRDPPQAGRIAGSPAVRVEHLPVRSRDRRRHRPRELHHAWRTGSARYDRCSAVVEWQFSKVLLALQATYSRSWRRTRPRWASKTTHSTSPRWRASSSRSRASRLWWIECQGRYFHWIICLCCLCWINP